MSLKFSYGFGNRREDTASTKSLMGCIRVKGALFSMTAEDGKLRSNLKEQLKNRNLTQGWN